MVLSKSKLKNGKEIKLEEKSYYFTITIGKRIWYWDKDTGEFDGTSYRVRD